MKRLFFFTTMMICALLALVGQQNKAEATNNSSNSPDWSAPVTLSEAPQGATGPNLATSNNGQLLLVYTHRAAEGDNPYYRLSTNNGISWTPEAPLYTSVNDSVQVYATFDNNNTAHAVWVEDESEIRYARQEQWGSSSNIISTSIIPPLDKPLIVVNGSNRLDMIWVQNAGANANIYHTYSINNGSNWATPMPIANTNPSSLEPAIAVGAGGQLHVVWAEGISEGFNAIAYAQGTLSGSSVTWTTPLIISDASIEDADKPQILVHNGIINVFYTRRETRIVKGEEIVDQYVDRLSCSINCTVAIDRWQSQGISGARLGANTQDPFNVISNAIAHQGCLYSYFHGTSDQYNETSELVWGVNSCSGWAASAPDRVTNDTHRSMFPTLASQGQWLLLAYESGLEGSNRQIEFRRALVESKLYLPIIFRG